MKINKAANVNEYITMFPKDVQKILEQVRQTIRKAAPEAKESISYAMPATGIQWLYLHCLKE